jgi:hypothetical protein
MEAGPHLVRSTNRSAEELIVGAERASFAPTRDKDIVVNFGAKVRCEMVPRRGEP